VTLADSSFLPANLTVAVGSKVTWKWDCTDSYGYGCPVHNIVFDDGSNQQSGTQDAGTYERIFPSAGTFNYHCAIHGASVMSAKIVVQ
jgi:plastocyanin